MNHNFPEKAQKIMNERFQRDAMIALATTDGTTPFVRAVNAYYENGAFYIVTDATSKKMEQIDKNPNVCICGDWFTAHGTGKNLGHVLAPQNKELMKKLRSAFSSWYNGGHVDEQNPNVCILCVRLTTGVLFSHGTKYNLNFAESDNL